MFLFIFLNIDYIFIIFFSFRHQANSFKRIEKVNAKKKTSKVKITNKAGLNKFNKGKSFGGPKQGRKRK